MVFLWFCFFGGVFVVWCIIGVVPEWCFCGGVFLVVWCSIGEVLEWCFCADVFLVVWWCFWGGVVKFLWWCSCVFCGGIFVFVFLWWHFCDCVLYVFFCQGSTFVILPITYAKGVDNTVVK